MLHLLHGVLRVVPELPFGPYTLLKRIAVGGMSEVFLARRGQGPTVVVKQILPQLARDPDLLQLFFDEAELAQTLDHPGIVEVFDFGQHEGTHYLAMEYVDGLDLDELEKTTKASGGIGVARAVHVVRRLADAVGYAHGARDSAGNPLDLVHRDISPQNVFLSVEGAVKLGDFGIARTRLRAIRTETGVLRGKMAYLAPERLSGEAATPAVDIYAIGVVLYEALAGKKPFAGDDPAMIKGILQGTPEPLRAILGERWAALAAIVERAMAKRPEDRFATAAELSSALAPFDAPGTAASLGAYVLEQRAVRDARTEQQKESRPPAKATETFHGLGAEPPPARAVAVAALHAEAPTLVDRATVDPSFADEDSKDPTIVARPDPETARQRVPVPELVEPAAQTVAFVAPRREARWLRGPGSWVLLSAVLLLGLAFGLGGASLSSAPRTAPEVVPASPSPSAALLVPPRPIELLPTEIDGPQIPASVSSGPKKPRTSPKAPAPAPEVEAGFGELSIDADPWAYVSVQGRALGPTPLAHVRLPAGQHRVLLENPEHKISRTVSISIKTDQRTSVRVRLSDGKLLR